MGEGELGKGEGLDSRAQLRERIPHCLLSMAHPAKLKFTGEAENKWIARACETCKTRQGKVAWEGEGKTARGF